MPTGRKPKLVPEAAPIKEILEAPEWLDEDAAAEWRRIMPDLTARKILTDADLGSLENYCIAIGQVREAERILRAEGLVVETKAGPKRHPASTVLKDAMTLARQLASELGLTPVSRSRPAVRDDSDDDDLLA
jgi:P27 family predicted phage terminase small subunit